MLTVQPSSAQELFHDRDPTPPTCSTRSTPSSARSPRRCAARCGCWPAPAPARPGRSPTASPTASPTGVYAPDRGARGHLHHPGGRRDARPAARARRRRRPGAHLPLRRAAPAALLLAARSTAASCPTLTESKLGAGRRRRPPPAGRRPTRRCCATSPPRSSGPRSATSAPTTTPRVAAAPRPRGRRPRPRRRSARVFGGYEEVKRAQGRMDMEDVLLLHRRHARRGRAGRRPGPRAVQVVRRRRVPGRLARSSRRCSTCGSAAATRSASSATRPRRSTPSPAPTPTTSATSRSKFPGTTSVELVRNYRSTPQVVEAANTAARRHRQRRRCGCAPSGPPAPRCATRRRADEVAEAEAVADAVGALLRRRARRRREIAVLFRINAQSEAFEEALAAPRHPLRRARRRPVLRARRGAAGGDAAARRRPRRRRRRRRPGRAACARRWPAWAGPPEAPAAPRPDPRPLGVAAGAGRPWPRSPPSRRRDLGDFVADLDRRAAEQHAPVAERRHPGDPPRRQGPGVGRRLPGRHARRRDARSPTPTTPAEIEEERRLLYVGMTRARERPHGLLGARPARPGGRGNRASRPGSSTGCCPTSARAAAHGASRKAQPRRALPRVRQAAVDAPPRRSAAAAPTARRPTTRSCSSGCARGARRGPTRRGAGVRGLHRRHARS